MEWCPTDDPGRCGRLLAGVEPPVWPKHFDESMGMVTEVEEC
jgi:hypothetical protein